MPQVHYIEHDGAEHIQDVPIGESVMRGALYNNIPGIAGECGGALSCATCRCFVDETWADRVGPPATHEERELLDAVADLDAGEPEAVRRRTRLSCQIIVTSELDGLVIRLPEKQYL